MNKLFLMLEDQWVAVAFAEAGEYEFFRLDRSPLCREYARIYAA